jgi:hypothetical protein
MRILRGGCLPRQMTVLRLRTIVVLLRASLHDPRATSAFARWGIRRRSRGRGTVFLVRRLSTGRAIVRKSRTVKTLRRPSHGASLAVSTAFFKPCISLRKRPSDPDTASPTIRVENQIDGIAEPQPALRAEFQQLKASIEGLQARIDALERREDRS